MHMYGMCSETMFHMMVASYTHHIVPLVHTAFRMRSAHERAEFPYEVRMLLVEGAAAVVGAFGSEMGLRALGRICKPTVNNIFFCIHQGSCYCRWVRPHIFGRMHWRDAVILLETSFNASIVMTVQKGHLLRM